jgi:GTP-binding protein Era
VTGILTVNDVQLIFLDTPGLLDAKDLLQRAMLGSALEAVREADVVLAVVDAARAPGPRDVERLETALARSSAPVHVAMNKMDVAPATHVGTWEAWTRKAGATAHRISAERGDGTAALLGALSADLPLGPFLYPTDDVASQSVRFFAEELVRETVFEQYEEEIPYSVLCRVEEFREDRDPVYIGVVVYVERASQKGILIGSGGAAIRALGQAARVKIEHFLERPVYLDLWVKPLKSWRKDRSRLGALGFRVPEDDDAASP